MAEEREITIKLSAKNLTAAGFQQAREQLAGLTGDTERTNKVGLAMPGIFKAGAAAFGGFAAVNAIMNGVHAAFRFVGDAAIGMNADLEQSTMQFTTLMGDADRAEAHVKSLFQFAKDTPFETEPIIAASKSLQTFGGNALNTMRTLTMVGDAAAAVGEPINEVGMWVGRLYSSLKGGQPIGEATARLMEMGVLAPETRAQLENLAKTAGGGQKAFQLFEAEMGRFGGAMEAQSNSWTGLASSILDGVRLMIGTAFEPFFDAIKVGMRAVVGILGSEGVTGAVKAFAAAVTTTFGVIGPPLIDAFFGTLQAAGHVGVTAAEVVSRAFAGLYLVFANVASVTSHAGIALLNLADTALAVQSKIPGMGQAMAGTRAELQRYRDTMVETQGMFQRQAALALETVQGNGKMAESFRGAHATIDGMRASLAEAAKETPKAGAGARQAGEQAREGGAGFESFADRVGKATKEGKDHGVVWGETSNVVRMQIIGVLNPSLLAFETHTDNAAEAMQDLIDNLHRASGAATTVAPVLASSMKMPFAQLPAAVTASGTATDGFFGKFKAALGESGMNASTLGNLFSQAFTGGGGALGALQAFATQGMGALLGMVPGVGPFLQQFAGPIIAGFGKIAAKVKSMFKGLFGGPDKDELAGREVVHAFEGNLATMLTAQQKAEAGGESWKMTVIAIRDAYIAQGRSAEEAMQDAERLWKSSKQGGAESERVVAEIERKMRELADATREATEASDEQADTSEDATAALAAQAALAIQEQARIKAGTLDLGAAASTAADGFLDIAGAIGRIPRNVDVDIRGRYTEDGDERPTGSYSIGTKGVHGTWFPDFSTGQVVRVDQDEAIVPRAKVGEFLRDMLGGMPMGGGGQAPNVYIVTDWSGPRQVTEAEFKQVQMRLNTGGLTVPARVITGRA